MMAMRRVRSVFSLVLVLAVLGLVGCANGSDDADTAAQSDATDGSASAGDAGGSASGDALAAGAEVAGEGREVIYTAELVVRVDDAEAAARQARDLVVAADGFVGQLSSDLDGDREVSLTLRIPAGELEGIIDELDDLGDVLQRDLDSQDVTDQVVDLERRIGNARVSADRLRELLAEADGVPNVLAIETELTKRETEIEVMTGQLQVVRDQVDLSTLTVRFTEETASDPEVADDLPGFVRAFKAGGVAVANLGLALLAVIGFCLPFVPIVAVGWFGYRWFRRRHPKDQKPPLPPQFGWPATVPGASASSTAWPPPPAAPPAATPAAEAPHADADVEAEADADAGPRSDTPTDEG